MPGDAVEAIKRLETRVADLLTLTDLRSLAERKTLIDIRRDLPMLFTNMKLTVDDCLERAGMSAELAEFQRRYSDLRHQVSVHQGAWSAAIIDSNPIAYKTSLRETYDMFRSVMEWARAILMRQERHSLGQSPL